MELEMSGFALRLVGDADGIVGILVNWKFWEMAL
jgi:hypothetical protein